VDTQSIAAASKAASSWPNTVKIVAHHGEHGQTDAAYKLLLPSGDSPATWPCLLNSFKQHGSTLQAAFDQLALVNEDGPVVWEHGRGLSALAAMPEHVYPHQWLSAHEAAWGIADLALDLLAYPLEGADPATQYRDAAELLTRNWRAVAMSVDEVKTLQLRIRGERINLLKPAAERREQDERDQGGRPYKAVASAQAIEALVDQEILSIVRSGKSASVRAIAICEADRRFLSYDSPDWAKLLGVTDAAIRKGRFWKEWLPEQTEKEREFG
jgi:hypothetical protein